MTRDPQGKLPQIVGARSGMAGFVLQVLFYRFCFTGLVLQVWFYRSNVNTPSNLNLDSLNRWGDQSAMGRPELPKSPRGQGFPRMP